MQSASIHIFDLICDFHSLKHIVMKGRLKLCFRTPKDDLFILFDFVSLILTNEPSHGLSTESVTKPWFFITWNYGHFHLSCFQTLKRGSSVPYSKQHKNNSFAFSFSSNLQCCHRLRSICLDLSSVLSHRSLRLFHRALWRLAFSKTNRKKKDIEMRHTFDFQCNIDCKILSDKSWNESVQCSKHWMN